MGKQALQLSPHRECVHMLILNSIHTFLQLNRVLDVNAKAQHFFIKSNDLAIDLFVGKENESSSVPCFLGQDVSRRRHLSMRTYQLVQL